MTFKVIFLFASLMMLTSARSNRVERQSPLSMGRKMIEGIRDEVQKTFQNFMGRFRNRNQNEFPTRNHRPRPATFQHPNFIQPHAPDPVFKTVTSSSFAVFHGGPTPAPFHNNHEFFHFNDISFPSHVKHQEENIHLEGNFIQHQNIVRPEKQKLFKSSPPVKRLPTSRDGWIALIPSANDARFPKPKKIRQQSKQAPKEVRTESFLTHSTEPTAFTKIHHPQAKNNDALISSKEIQFGNKFKSPPKKTKLQKSKQRLTEPKQASVKLHPIPSRTPEPIYHGDIKKPLHTKPTHDRDIISTTTDVEFVTNAVNLPLRSDKVKIVPPGHQFTDGQTGKLISNGLKLKLSPDKEKKLQVNGYEFGYGLVDEGSGNRFYHAEKKDGDQTKGSYKVQLPDGRIQTVDYLADNQGYHPKITFEGEAKYPGKKQVKKYARPSS